MLGTGPGNFAGSAEFQVPRVACERGIDEESLRSSVAKHTLARQFGFLGEPRVRVLELNLDLDAVHPITTPPKK